ncbi:helix-turn-helix domain-containing protein [Seleniivibrio woodruffii]|uniref:helix-turn-helix domain-containing protein n=1 Tax=Seleniivibrio woodruffii TaxID=1078050 RepID=UPI002409075A|nr:helix-turn-helix transcriptional regulator [Seleniivibrio woodruffii]
MQNFNETLGNQIRKYRKKKGFSQEKLAEKANISAKYLGEVERGEYNISASLLYDIATALEIPVSELFEFEKISDDDVLKKQIIKYIDSANSEQLNKLDIFVKKIL